MSSPFPPSDAVAGGGNTACEPLVHLKAIEKSFGSAKVLDGIDLRVFPGEIVGLLGENGAGKSTLMNITSGGLQADNGEVIFDGETRRFTSIQAGIDAGISFVHQELSIIGSLSVAENLFLGRMPRGPLHMVDYPTMRTDGAIMLESVGARGIDPQAKASDLRTGEQQLVEIAKAAARKPKLLILDEPTSSLTPHEVKGFKAYIRRARDEGAAIIFITHRLEEAMEVCDRILVLRNGQLVADRKPDATNKEQLINDMTGKPSLFTHKARSTDLSKTLLRLHNVGDGGHVSDICFDVHEGEIFGLFGLVGAGRTEVLELICGARALVEGEIELFGKIRCFGSPNTALNAGVVLVPEGRKTAGILPQHSVRRNVSASSLRTLSHMGFVDRQSEQASVKKLSNDLSIKMASDTQAITTLSGGNQQKAIFARTFLARPRLLLLDEPTHGVDVGAKGELYEIIRAAADEGMTVLLASSEIPEIMAICDRVAVLSKGALAGVFGQDQISEQVLLNHAFSKHEAA